MADCFFVGGAAITRDERRMQRKRREGENKKRFLFLSRFGSHQLQRGEGREGRKGASTIFLFLFSLFEKDWETRGGGSKDGFFSFFR